MRDRKKITLTRSRPPRSNRPTPLAKARTIQVEVRKKRTFVKRDDAPAVEEVAAAEP